MSEKIRIIFDGPPSHESGRFVEVENEHGESLSFGEWKEEGDFWYLEFSNPVELEAKVASLDSLALAEKVRGDELEAENERLQYKVEARDKEICALLRVIDKQDALKEKP